MTSLNVQAALACLNQSDDALQRAQANEWLITFLNSGQAFDWGISIFHQSSSQPDAEQTDQSILLYAANAIHTNLKSQIKSLNQDQAQSINQTILSCLHQSITQSNKQQTGPITARLARSIALLALSFPAQLDPLVQSIHDSIKQTLHQPGSQTAQHLDRTILTGLAVYEALAEEAIVRLGNAHRNNSATLACIPVVCAVIHISLERCCNQSIDPSVSQAISAACVRCLGVWASVGLKLTLLHQYGLINQLISLLKSQLDVLVASNQPNDRVDTAELIISGLFEAMESAIESDSYSIVMEDATANQTIIQSMWNSSLPVFDMCLQLLPVAQNLVDQSNKNSTQSITSSFATKLMRHLASLFGALVVGQIDTIQSNNQCNNQSVNQFPSLLCQFARSPYTSQSILFALLTIADAPINPSITDSPSMFSHHWWYQMVDCLIHGQVLDDSVIAQSADDIDQDELNRVREEFQSVLAIACAKIGIQEYQSICLRLIDHGFKNQSINIVESAAAAGAVVINQCFEQSLYDPFTRDKQHSLNHILNESLNIVLSVDHLADSAPTLLLQSISQFVHGVTTINHAINDSISERSGTNILNSAPDPPQLARSAMWLINACRRSEAAGRAIKQVMKSFGKQLSTDQSLNQVINQSIGFMPNLLQSWPRSCTINFTEGLSAYLQHLTPQSIHQSIEQLIHVLFNVLDESIKQSTQSHKQSSIIFHVFALFAKLFSAIDNIENSNTPPDNQAIIHYESSCLQSFHTRCVQSVNQSNQTIIDRALVCCRLSSDETELSCAKTFLDSWFACFERSVTQASNVGQIGQSIIHFISQSINQYLSHPSPVFAIVLRSVVTADSSIYTTMEQSIHQYGAPMINATTSLCEQASKQSISQSYVDCLLDNFLHLCRTPVSEWLNFALSNVESTNPSINQSAAVNLIDLALRICHSSSDQTALNHAVTCLQALLEVCTQSLNPTNNPSVFYHAFAARCVACIEILSPLIFPERNGQSINQSINQTINQSNFLVSSEARSLIVCLIAQFPAQLTDQLVIQIRAQCSVNGWSVADTDFVSQLAHTLISQTTNQSNLHTSSHSNNDVFRQYLFSLHRALPEGGLTQALRTMAERATQTIEVLEID